jgi:20S proteasome alpha/beta subunit
MTYILGFRCLDGVVLIADTKFTTDRGNITFTYDNQKIIAGISGVIMAFAGTRGKFELFQSAITDYIETSARCNKIVKRKEFLLKAFELTRKYMDFEILIGI